MKNTKKRLLSMLLAVVMTLSLVPFTAFAVGVDNVENDVTLPNGITAESFPKDTTVTDGENYYATLALALEGIHLNTDKRTLWCKPNADVGTMTHGHVCASLTVYGNGAYVSGGEQEFEVDTYKYCHKNENSCQGLTSELTLKVIALNGAGAWGERKTQQTVNCIFEDCEAMSRVYISGVLGVNNITLTNCTFTSNITSNCKVYSNANGTVMLSGCTFLSVGLPVNLNHKAVGNQNVSIDGCEFEGCGTADADYSAPVRVLSSVEGGETQLTVKSCIFSGTVANKLGQNMDVLLDYGVGITTADVSATVAKVGVEESNDKVAYTDVAADQVASVSNTTAVAVIGDTKYAALAAAFSAAKKGDTVKLLKDVTLTETVGIYDGDVLDDVTFDGDGHVVTLDLSENDYGIRFGKDKAYADGVTVKNVTVETKTNTKADIAISFNGGQISTLTAVTVKGDYKFAGVNFGGTNGGNVTQCDFVSVFTNCNTNFPITLKNTKISYIQVNCSVNEFNGLKLKLAADDTSSYITKLHVHEENTLKIDPKLFENDVVGALTLGDERDDPAAAVVDNVYYTKLEDALLAADSATVKLLANASVDGYVILDNSTVLDLNGNTLTCAKSVLVSSGAVIDSAVGMNGLLVIKSGKLMFPSTAAEYIPVFELTESGENSYRFAKLNMQIDETLMVVAEDGTSVTFQFRPNLGSTELNKKYFANGTGNSGLTFAVCISWIGTDGNAHSETVTVSDTVVSSAYTNDKMIKYTLSEISADISELRISVSVASNTGAVITDTAYSANGN